MPGDITGKKYSIAELRGLAKQAGFTGADVNIAAAVAMAESGGDSRSYNPVGRDDSYGLWQINMKGDLGPDRRKKFGIAKNADLFDPGINARAAKRIKNDSGWGAWTTYTSGKYKKFLTTADTSEVVTPSDSINAVDDGSLVGGIKAAINSLGDNLLKTGANVGGILAAIALVVVGVLLLARNQIPYKKVARVLK